MDANNDYANVSWKHNFSVDNSEFVLEFTLDSKSQMHLPRAYKGNATFTEPTGDPNHPLIMFNWASFYGTFTEHHNKHYRELRFI